MVRDVFRNKKGNGSDSDDCRDSASKDMERKLNAATEAEGVPFHHTPKVPNMMSSNFRREAHDANVCKENIQF